jgi:hypothetical protein
MEENPTAPDVVRDGGTTIGSKNNAMAPPLGKPPEKDKGKAPEQPSDAAEKG